MCAFLLVYPFDVFAESPTAQIKTTVDQVIQILTDAQLQGENRKQEHRKRLRETIFIRSIFSRWRNVRWGRSGSAELRRTNGVYKNL